MSRHSFDPKIAAMVGLNAAVIYQNIAFWCERNAIKSRNIHDGNSWTYNSIREMGALFSYMTEKQVRTAMQKLEDDGLLEVGNYNKESRDRTKWYSLSTGGEAFALLVKPHLPLRAERFAPEGKALPDSKPDIKLPPNPQGGSDLFQDLPEQKETDQLEVLIAEAWEEFQTIWPKGHPRRQMGKSGFKAFDAACRGNIDKASGPVAPNALNRAARAYIASVDSQRFIKGTVAWLNGALWEPFVDGASLHNIDDLSGSARRLLENGKVPPSMMMADGKPNEIAKYWLNEFGKGSS